MLLEFTKVLQCMQHVYYGIFNVGVINFNDSKQWRIDRKILEGDRVAGPAKDRWEREMTLGHREHIWTVSVH